MGFDRVTSIRIPSIHFDLLESPKKLRVLQGHLSSFKLETLDLDFSKPSFWKRETLEMLSGCNFESIKEVRINKNHAEIDWKWLRQFPNLESLVLAQTDERSANFGMRPSVSLTEILPNIANPEKLTNIEVYGLVAYDLDMLKRFKNLETQTFLEKNLNAVQIPLPNPQRVRNLEEEAELLREQERQVPNWL